MSFGWILVIIFSLVSIILLSGKVGFLIAGYNTLEEKENVEYDEKKLSKTIGILMTLITLATVLLNTMPKDIIRSLYPVFIITSIIITIMYANREYENK